MATSFKKKIFLLVFCLASITQGMYSTYFVSILTTIERIYQIQSKTAGAILSATEIGQILGSLFIAYYGGRGNKPKWISVCMTLSAFAALISISPHFILLATNNQQHQAAAASSIVDATSSSSSSSSSLPSPYLTSDLSSGSSSGSINDSNGTTSSSSSSSSLDEHHQRVRNITTQLAAAAIAGGGERAHTKVELLPSFDQLCRIGNYTGSRSGSTALNTTATNQHNIGESISNTHARKLSTPSAAVADFPNALVISIFSICLLAIGFGSTAITTLGIPFIDDIISREESPFYLGLTIGLRIFGPALGFLLGSFCIRLNANSLLGTSSGGLPMGSQFNDGTEIGAWWLGLVIISLPLLVLAIPMYFLSRFITGNDNDEKDDYEDITYQAAEDHDIGGSHDFPAHVLGLTAARCDGGGGDLDVTSSRTCFSSGGIDSTSREVLQMCGGGGGLCNTNYGQNIAFVEQPILATSDCMKTLDDNEEGGLTSAQRPPIGEWRALAAPSVRRLVVNQLNDFEDESQIGAGAAARQQQQQACPLSCAVVPAPYARPTQPEQPARRSSTRSSVASTMSSSSTSFVGEVGDQITKSGKLKRRAQQHQHQHHHHHHTHKGDHHQAHNANKSTIGDLSSSLWRLLRNKLLVLRMLSGVLHILPIAGFYTFLPKYLIEQFRISSSSASAISGLAGILFVGFGAFIGGTIIRVFNVNSRIMTRWIATSALVYALGMIVLMNLDCQQNQIVHFNSLEFVSTDCSHSCHCSRTTFNPVCANGTTFMSPCLAGCKGHTILDGGQVIFGECGCAPRVVPSVAMASNESFGLTALTAAPGGGGSDDDGDEGTRHSLLNIATQGQCLNNCDNIIWYVILFSIFTLVHASCEVGSMMFNLRCVKSNDRTLALGLITFSSSLLGTIPCSIIYGSVVDFTCVHWDTYISPFVATADSSSLAEDAAYGEAARGACRAYDNNSFRYYLHGLTALVMSIAFIVDCIISSRANEVDFYEGTDESKMDIRIGLKKSTETIQ